MLISVFTLSFSLVSRTEFRNYGAISVLSVPLTKIPGEHSEQPDAILYSGTGNKFFTGNANIKGNCVGSKAANC